MANEDRRKLFNAINEAGYDVGDYDEFDKRMNNAEDRQKFFQAVNDAGFDIGDQADFESRISPSKYKLNINGNDVQVSEREYMDFMHRNPSGRSLKPQKPAAQTKPQMAPAAVKTPETVEAPEVEAPDDIAYGNPWGTPGSATGQSRKYKPFAPGQVRTTDNPDAELFPNPTQQTYAERDQILKQKDWAARQIEKMQKERERRNQPMVDTGNEDVNQHIIKTQGEFEDDVMGTARNISSSIVAPAVDKAIADFDKKAEEVYAKYNEQSKYVDSASPFGMSTIRQANQTKDPEKVLQYLTQQMEGVLKSGDFTEKIGQEADKLGIDRKAYLEEIIAPQIMNDMVSRFENTMIARELPKSGLEYVISGLNNSIVGMIADTFLNTKSQRAYQNQAQAMTEEGLNPNYNPSTSASLAKIGVTFAADAPFFGVYGRVGGQVVKSIAEREIQKMVASGLSENAARSIVGTALENSVGARMKNYIMQHVVSSSITMGGFNATSEAVRQVRDDDYNLARFLGSTAEGLATGAAFGVTGGATQALSQPLTGFAKLGSKVAGYGAEAETMYATEEAAKALMGEDAFENPFEGSVESLMKLGVMKLSSGHLAGKATEKLIRAKEVGAKQAAMETAADIWNRKRTGMDFTKDEEAYVRSEGQSLLDALSNMHPDRAISEVNGKVKLTDEGEAMRQQLAESYNEFMDNKEVPANVKQKVAKVLGGIYRPGLETGADIIQNEDGSAVIKTRDKDGNCIQDIPFESYDQAVEWQQQFKSQMSRNDATNMWNGASEQARANILYRVAQQIKGNTLLTDEIRQAGANADPKRLRKSLNRLMQANKQRNKETAGDEMTPDEVKNYVQMVIKDGGDEVFNDLYNIIRQEAYPADELNTKRNYWEGKQVSDLEKHYIQVDTQLAEEKLMLQGEDFAKEVMEAADYPDEKMAELAARLSRGQITANQLNAALDYYNKVSKLNGVMDETLNGIDNEVEAANAYVRKNIHPDSGSIIEVQQDGRTYYVTAGHVQITPDGKLVGTDNSGMVILRDVNTGEIETKNPNEVVVSAIKDPQRLIDANESMDGLRGELLNKANETIEINPETPQEPAEDGEYFIGADGKQYITMNLLDEQGNSGWYKMEVNKNGVPTGEAQPLDMAEYRKAKSDELDAAERPQEEPVVEQEAPVIEQEQPVLEQEQPKIEQPETPETPSEPQSKIPVNDKGEQLFEQAKPEDTLAELNARYGEEKAQKMIASIAQATAKELKKLEAKDTSGITDMAKLMKHEDKVKELQQKRDYWNNLIKKEEPVVEPEPVAETPVTEEPVVEAPVAEVKPETPAEPEPVAEVKPAEEPKQPVLVDVEPETIIQKPAEPQQPETPVVSEKSAQQKVYEATVAQNVGKRLTFTDKAGIKTVITIDSVTDDGKVQITRQDFDADGKALTQARQQTVEANKLAPGIIDGRWKPVATTEEKLRQAFKGKPAMQNMIDVLSEEEQQRMLDVYESKDQDAFYELMDEYRENHREDIILKERDERNASVDRILNGAGSREEKLRRVRKQFQGYDDAEVSLSDEALQPTTLEEYISEIHSRVPAKGEGVIAYYSYGDGADKVVGLQDETGYGIKTGADTKGFAPWLAPKGKGMSLQKYAEQVHSQLPEAVQEQYTDQDVRNAILEVFGGAERPSDIPLMIIRRGVLQAEQAARRLEEAIIDGDMRFHKADRSFGNRLKRAIQQTATEPTEKQKEAGNYAKGHLSFGGYHFSIENPKGGIRRGTDADGRAWEQQMNNTYGYILGKKGKDGDHLDMFINDNADLDNWNGKVYVVDQVDPKTGKFDESKVLYGFNSEEEARQAYLSNYEKGWKGLGKITGVDKETFDKWLDSSDRQKKEFADHSIIKHKVDSQVANFDNAAMDLNTRGLSIDDKELLDKYGLKSVTLSKRGDHVSMTHLVVNEQGQGNGTRFMEDLARLADEQGWTLTLTPGLGLGAKSKKRLEQFYKRFGFKANKGRNADYSTMDAMVRQPKDWNPNTPERQQQALRDVVIDHLRQQGVEVSTDWELGQKIIDRYNGTGEVNEQKTEELEGKPIQFFKTKDGHAYGFTWNGKIFIDPRIATSETPIHEFGHLWVQAKREAAPEEWNEIKSVMLNDQMVQPIIDKVRKQYPELTKEGREDDLAEEIITQFSGRRGNERLQEITNEIAQENKGMFGKAEAVAAMQRLKNILNRFWEGIAKMFGWKYRNANHIADKMLADMLNGVDVRRERNRRRIAAQKAEEQKPIFISNAEKAVEGIKQEKATPEQWLAMIEKNGGLKAGEDKWLGLSDWLKEQQKDKKSITKQEVQDYIRQNQIQIEETRYAEGVPEEAQKKLNEFNQEFEELIWEGDEATQSIYTSDWVDWAYNQMVERYGDDFRMAFDYEGNGTNTRLFPTMNWNEELSDAAKYFLDIDAAGEQPINSTRLDYTTEGLRNKKEIALTVPTIEPYNQADDLHFGDAGEGRAVAWARFGETTDADGNKVLVVDEIQSKRHQDAREQGGYKEDVDSNELAQAREASREYATYLYNKYITPERKGEDFLDYANEEEKAKFHELTEKVSALVRQKQVGVPSAPFEKNWHELAMKRILRYAAENGYDKVAWTTGGQQAERYNIGNVIDQVERSQTFGDTGETRFDLQPKDNSGSISLFVKDGVVTRSAHEEFEGKRLKEVVGKDLAAKMLEMSDHSSLNISEMVIGGEGMRGFYDEMLPRFMNKYGKKWGVKVGEVDLPDTGLTMHSVDVTPEMRESVMQGQPMFQKVSKEDQERTLMGMHNISEEKLKKALKLGGLANPSMAVVDTKNGVLDNFGEISLIPSKRLIDKKTGRNVGTWASDAYTPRFPSTYLRISDKNRKQLKKYIDSLGLNDEMSYQLWQQFNDYYNSFSIKENALQYAFLKEKGLTDQVDYVRHDDVSPKFEALIDKYGKNVEEMIQRTRTDEEFRKEVGDMIIAEETANAMKDIRREEGENPKDYMERRKKYAATIRKLLTDENDIATFNLIDYFLRTNSQKMNENGKFDGRETLYRTSRYISDNKLQDEYAKYFADKAEEFGIEEMIRDGSDRQGRPKFKTVTLEDISRRMKKEGRAGGEGGFGDSPGALRAKLTPMLNSLEEIRREKGRLVSHEDFEAEKDPYFEEVFHIQQDLFNGDYEDMLKVLQTKDMEATAKRLGYELDAEDLNDLKVFKNLTLNLPTEYFETKFERPVTLDEFEIAVVPETTDPKVIKALKDAGLDVRTYAGYADNPEGASEARREAIMDAVSNRDDIRFQMVGEKGAAEADKAEGNTKRQESLNIADQMEKDGKDSKAIKFATGWERGKDGKWRYETVDQKVDILAADKQAAKEWRTKVGELRKKEDSLYRQFESLDRRIPKKLDSRYTDEEKKKYREMRKQRDELWKQYLEAGKEHREALDDTERIMKLRNVMGEDHELFKYYPQLKDVDIRVTPKMQTGVAGSYNPEEGIKLSWHETRRFNSEELNNDNMNEILVHEIQHAIQDIEGFAKGGNLYTSTTEAGIKAIIQDKKDRQQYLQQRIDFHRDWLYNPEELKLIAELDRRTVEEEEKVLNERLIEMLDEYDRLQMYIDKIKHDKAPSMTDAQDLYRRLAGEVEARNASERMQMNEEERRRTPIEKTEDYARDKQVVIMDYDGESGSIKNLDEVNTKFNDELKRQIDHGFEEGGVDEKHVYKLGNPSEALKYAGVADLPIEMTASKLLEKASESYKSNHPYSLNDVVNLPEKIQRPIAVFDSETDPNNKVILTELTDKKGHNFIAAIGIHRLRGRNIVEFNSIRSLYPKDSNGRIAKWFDSEYARLTEKGKEPLLKWADTKKALDWLANHAADVHAVGLSSKRIAKIIQKFDNAQDFSKKIEKVNNSQAEETPKFQKVDGDITSDNFKNWFGDWEKDPKHASKVVDENGKPKVVYHGTKYAGFNEFFTDYGMAWFASTKKYADIYSDLSDVDEWEVEDSNMKSGRYAVYLNLRNPIDLGKLDYEHGVLDPEFDKIAQQLDMTPEELRKACGFSEKQNDYIFDLTRTKEFSDIVKSKGYDGAMAVEGNGVRTYGIVDPSQVKSATENNGEYNPENPDIRFQKVEDKDELEKLENEPTVKRYRAMQLIDGKLYPPMSAKVNGKMRQPTEIGVWEKAEENPELAKNGKFTLNKAQKGQSSVPAAYNPYFHTSTSGLNDQFTSAYRRPELVVVEVEIPESELTSGYKAEGAKDAVGDTNWHSGPVNGMLPDERKRTVTLSRYSKVNRIVPDSEVADMIAKQLEGLDIEIPYNVVTKSLRKELEAKGVKFSATPSGTVSEDIDGNAIEAPKFQKVSKPTFYSNAEKAVEGIKQDKGTPEQWLKMIEKNGGLKAGEDKWLGLSDWLKEQQKDKKSITKQEIQDYIRENQIQVADANYEQISSETIDSNPRMIELRKEFDELVTKYNREQSAIDKELEAFDNEMYEKYGEGWRAADNLHKLSVQDFKRNEELTERWRNLNSDVEDLAFREMYEKYGDDFTMGFEVDANGKLQPIEDYYSSLGINDYAAAELAVNNPINSTRLNYTSKGLDNKKEIALVVPTIDPYKEGDEIHFGDAGGGRAVAWVRFGDTTLQVPDDGGAKEAEFKRIEADNDQWYSEHPELAKYGIGSEELKKESEERKQRQRAAYDAVQAVPNHDSKVLVIDEIQSKRHQDAREMGYKGEYKNSPRGQYMEAVYKVDAARNMLAEKYGEFWVKEDLTEAEQKHYQELYDDMVAKGNYKDDKPYSVPDAPFEKNWHELAMKRMLRYAAEHGYDKIAWTTGSQQAKRYALSKAVRSVRNSTSVMGPNWYTLVPQGGAQMRFHVGEDGKIDRVSAGGWGSILDHTIPELFGKDAAAKIEALKDNEVIDFENQEIGGEGMRGFYDEMLPRFMNKYGKKWGVKVGQTILPGLNEHGEKMWTIDVTPEMKESVMQGQPMFQREGNPEPELTPEERQYWNKWSEDMRKWKERNAIPEIEAGPGPKPKFQQGESALEYAQRLVEFNRKKALWNTAPKLEDYRQKRTDKDTLEAARENEKRYPDSPSAKMRRVAAELQQIRHAMSEQKAYDKATVKAVTDFAQDFMKMGFGDNLSRGEMERMLSSVKNATGAKDIKREIDNILNILMDNHLRNLDQRIVKLSSTKELSKTAQGVEKQGKLELKGQRMIQAFREAREGRMDAEAIRNRMNEVAEKMSRNDEEAPMWEQEYEGLSIALQYQENIEASRDEWAELDREYKDAVKNYRTSGRSYKAQQELLESLDQAMMENKIERIGMFGDVIGRLEGNIAESMQGAKEFVEREKQRINKIHSIANFDLAGKDMGAMRESTKGKPANFFLQPLGTFEQMLKMFGERNAKGEGNLYDYFMRTWIDSTDQAFVNEQKAKEELDAKAREVFGDKVKRWNDLYELTRRLPSLEVDVLDGEEPKTFTLNQGNLLYIYMADKMNDGRMKLRKMGIDEEKVEAIKDFLDPRLVQLGDWLQDEYLVNKRTEYNKVHERMFGAPMAAIDHYFPIKILGDARVQEQDVANMADQDAVLPSTITGNIIKRRKNALPLDILHTDALSLAIEHVEDMERWAATAEWNKDINTLLSYTTFRNKVKNMNTIYGSGDALWNIFADTARMAAGTYRPKAKPGSVDSAISNIAKGVTAAKINFRVYTAFKQLLSAPAFLHDVNLADFVKDGLNPYGSWKWAMENMPVFRKRWKSRQVGDTRLMDDPTDWKMWKTNVVQMATRMGMSPNALVDGVTCAVGARAIYESRYKKYKQVGASDEVARKRALQDAEIGYNLTQQSSEGAFVSAIQKDRTVAANMLSVFRNSSMAYTRQWVDAARNLSHRMQKGYKEDSIEFMTRQFQEQFGLDEDKAKQAAEAEYNRAGRHEIAKMLNMMFGVTIAWNLGASLPYLLMGDDDKTKKEMVTDAMIRGMIAGPSEGFAAGNLMSEFVSRTIANEQFRKDLKNGWGAAVDTAIDQGGDYEINPLPLMADLQGMIKKLGYDKFAAAQDVFNICMQSAVGVNPQTFTDMWNAVMDYAAPGWDGRSYTFDEENIAKSKELALFIMRLMNAPTSSWKNKYIDELGLEAEEAQKLSYDDMARRYAHYKHWKETPIMGWLRGDEARNAKIDKLQMQFDKAVKERMERLSDAELQRNVARSETSDEKRRYAKLIANRLGIDPGASASKPSENQWYQDVYQQYMQYEDIKEDETLAAKAKEIRDEKAKKEINQRLKWIREGKFEETKDGKKKAKGDLLAPGKKQLETNGDEKRNEVIMSNIRKWRKEALEIALRADTE